MNFENVNEAPFKTETDGICFDLINFDEADLPEIIADAVEGPTIGAAIISEVAHTIIGTVSNKPESSLTILDTGENTSVPLPAAQKVDNLNRPLICNEQNLRSTPNTPEKNGFLTKCIKQIKESYLDSRRDARENLLFSIAKLGGSLILDSILNIPVYASNLVLRPVNFVFRKISISPIKVLNYMFNRSKFKDINNLKLSSKNKLKLKNSRSISQLLSSINKEENSNEYVDYTRINPQFMDEDFNELLDLNKKTSILTAKLFSYAIKENYDDGIYREKFFKLMEKLMKILDNYQKIEYFATQEFFMNDLNEINKVLDNINESRIKCEILDTNFLKKLESNLIQNRIKLLVQNYILNHEETFLFDIYDYQEEVFLTEISELSDIQSQVNTNSALKDKDLNYFKDKVLERLYAYSQEEKLSENKELLIVLATNLVEIVNITCPEKFLKLMKRICKLENEILDLIER